MVKRIFHKSISVIISIGLLTWSFPVLSPQVAQAVGEATAIRQEINILNSVLSATTGNAATSSERIQINGERYNGATYYFEVVTQSTLSLAYTVTLRNATSSAIISTISVPTLTTAYTRLRSTSFSTSSIPTQYVVTIGNEIGATKNVKAARIIILQNGTSIAETQNQIEIGNNETYSATATSTFASPKYWTYTAANWDATSTNSFSASVAYKFTGVGAVASSTSIAVTGTTTHIIPIGTASTTIALRGGGGAGGAGTVNTTGSGSGGAGSMYGTTALYYPELSGHYLFVAAGGLGGGAAGARGATSTWDVTTVRVGGGNGGAIDSGAGGTGNSTGCVATSCFAGGNGAAGTSAGVSGGGGEAASSTGTGNSASAGTGGTGGNGGDGAAGTTLDAIGNTGGTPGGGGAGGRGTGSTDRAGGPGAVGSSTIVNYIATTTIFLEQDDGAFANWTAVAFMVATNTPSQASPTTTIALSGRFIPIDGRNYRVAFKAGVTGEVFAIYNAKILVTQGGGGNVNTYSSTQGVNAELMYLSAIDSTSLAPAAAMTIEFWIYINDMQPTGQWGFAVGKDIVGAREWAVGYYTPTPTSTVSYTSVQMSGGGTTINNGNIPLEYGKWYHLAYTWETTGKTFNYYVNGVLDVSTTYGTNPVDSTNDVTIGRRLYNGAGAAANNGCGCLVDDVRIWNVQRTQPQIIDAMGMEIDSATSLKASWHINGNISIGNGLTDSSGNANTLTNNGSGVSTQQTPFAGSSVALLEVQYLLANTLFVAGTALQDFDTLYTSTDFATASTTFYHEASSISGGLSDLKLQSGAETGGTPTDITGTTITDTIQRERTAAFTMPASGSTIDTIATTNNGDLYSSRIIVVVYRGGSAGGGGASTGLNQIIFFE